MRKKSFCTIIALTALLALGTSANAAVYVNDQNVSDTVFTVQSGDYVLFPVRYLGEQLGCDVYWDFNDCCITVSKDGTNRDFYNDATEVYDWNGNSYSLVTAPMLVDGNTMVPPEFFRDHFGASVIWDSVTDSFFINSDDTYRWLVNTEEYRKATQPEEIYGYLSEDEAYNLSAFLSYFSAAHFDQYDHGYTSADDMIYFAIAYDKIKGNNTLQYKDGEIGISAFRVNQILEKYLDKTIPAISTENWWYDGHSFWAIDENRALDRFSVVNTLTDMKDGTYSVNFTNYHTGNTDPKYYSYSHTDAENDPDCAVLGSKTAIIKPYGDTWQLIYLW